MLKLKNIINNKLTIIIIINLFIGLTKIFKSSKNPRIKLIKPSKTKKVIFSLLKKCKKYTLKTVTITNIPPSRATASLWKLWIFLKSLSIKFIFKNFIFFKIRKNIKNKNIIEI